MKAGATPGTSFLKRYASPNDIVVKAAALAGVAGTLVTLADGMLVPDPASRFQPDGPQVEVVLKSADAEALAEAVAWIEPALAATV